MLKIIFMVLVLSGCDGTETPLRAVVDIEEKPIATPAFYRYSMSFNGVNYGGVGVRSEDTIYFHPGYVSNNRKTSVVDIRLVNNDVSEINIYDYVNRSLIISLTEQDNYILTLTEVTGELVSDIELNTKWFQSTSAGWLGESIIEFNYTDGMLTGSDSNGCIYNGRIKDSMVVVTLSNCYQSGDYRGSLLFDNGRIRGAITNGVYGIALFYYLV